MKNGRPFIRLPQDQGAEHLALAGFSGSQKLLAGIRQRWRRAACHGQAPSLSARALLSG